MNEIIGIEVENAIDTLLPNGSGVVSEARFRHVVGDALRRVYSVGGDAALSSLMTIDNALIVVNRKLQNENRDPISKRRLQAIARNRHDRFGVGYQVAGTGVWLFRPDEIENLVPREYNREETHDV